MNMSSILFGNSSEIVRWKSDCATRGTFDILSTCIITLLLCIWTAVHLNVPPPGQYLKPILKKVGWLFLALLAPEMVAYTAWYQRQEALTIMRTVNESRSLPSPIPWYTKWLSRSKRVFVKGVRMAGMQKEGPTRQPTLEAQNPHLTGSGRPWTVVHGFYVAMGGLAVIFQIMT